MCVCVELFLIAFTFTLFYGCHCSITEKVEIFTSLHLYSKKFLLFYHLFAALGLFGRKGCI